MFSARLQKKQQKKQMSYKIRGPVQGGGLHTTLLPNADLSSALSAAGGASVLQGVCSHVKHGLKHKHGCSRGC